MSYIKELDDSNYEVVKPIPVTLQPDGEEFQASFFDANVHTAGATDQEALDNLRSLILDTFDTLVDLAESELAPAAQRQRAVLRRYVRRAPA